MVHAYIQPQDRAERNPQFYETASRMLARYDSLTPTQVRIVVAIRAYMDTHAGAPAPIIFLIHRVWSDSDGFERAKDLSDVICRARPRLARLGETLAYVRGQGYVWEVTK